MKWIILRKAGEGFPAWGEELTKAPKGTKILKHGRWSAVEFRNGVEWDTFHHTGREFHETKRRIKNNMAEAYFQNAGKWMEWKVGVWITTGDVDAIKKKLKELNE